MINTGSKNSPALPTYSATRPSSPLQDANIAGESIALRRECQLHKPVSVLVGTGDSTQPMQLSNLEDLCALYEAVFGARPKTAAAASGRAEGEGNHTDYNKGETLSFALRELKTYALASTSATETFMIVDAKHGVTAEFNPQALSKCEGETSWVNYVQAVVEQFNLRFPEVKIPRGVNLMLYSEVPLGGGLSSSAALTTAVALALSELLQKKLTRAELIEISHAAECSRIVGGNCGYLDQYSVCCAAPNHLVHVDYSVTPPKEKLIPLPADAAFIVIDSRVKHDNRGYYKELRANCEAAAAKLGVANLSLTDETAVRKARNLLSPQELGCALHIVGENARVRAADRGLTDGSMSLQSFGKSMIASHVSSRDNFHNSDPVLDALVGAAVEAGALGARLSGGGCGGNVLILTTADKAAQLVPEILTAYEKRRSADMPAGLEAVVVTAGGAAEVLLAAK